MHKYIYKLNDYNWWWPKFYVLIPAECEVSCQTCSPMIGRNVPPTINEDIQLDSLVYNNNKGKDKRNKKHWKHQKLDKQNSKLN